MRLARAAFRRLKWGLISLYKAYALWRELRYLRALPLECEPSYTHLERLLFAWDNPWSPHPEYLMAVAGVARKSTGPVLECGCGVTTIILGIIAERTNKKVYSLEHIDLWADRVQRVLQSLHLTSVHLIRSPLGDYGEFSWYKGNLDDIPSGISVVVCDGPPEGTRGGRYGLVPIMRRHFASGCAILLDDADRQGEQHILRRWCTELGATAQFSNPEASLAPVRQYALLLVP